MVFGVIFFCNLIYSFFRCYAAETREEHFKAIEYMLISIPVLLVIGVIVGLLL